MATGTFYLGLDVGKRWHEAALLDEAEHLVWRHRVRPTRAGLEEFGRRLAGVEAAQVVVGLEATGPYWLTLHAWLADWGPGRLVVLNPLQTRAFRNANLRGAKTDRIDAVAIARLLRWAGEALSAHAVPPDRQQAARELSRLHVELTELRARQLVRLRSLLDRAFPELSAHVAGLGGKGALALLARWPTPALLAAADPAELGAVLRQASRGAWGAAKAEALLALARSSVGTADPYDATATAVRTLVSYVEHAGEQLRALARRLDEVLAPDEATRALLESIPGFGAGTARTWLAEALPIDRVYAKNGADKLVASVGLDAQLKESGRSAGKVRMSKRGNRYLRRALMLAAETAARTDLQCKAILRRQILRGKHYRVAVSHVARKLVHIAYSVLVHRRPYELPAEYRLGVIEPTPEANLSPSGA
jgi:transposase